MCSVSRLTKSSFLFQNLLIALIVTIRYVNIHHTCILCLIYFIGCCSVVMNLLYWYNSDGFICYLQFSANSGCRRILRNFAFFSRIAFETAAILMPFDIPFYLFQSCASRWNSPKLFISSSTPFHYWFLRLTLCVLLSASIAVQYLIT